MDRPLSSPREGPEANFPGVFFDFMDVEGDGEENGHHCQQCPFGEEERRSSWLGNEEIDNQQDSGAVGSGKNELTTKENTNQKDNENEESDSTMSDGGVHPLLFPDVIRDVLNFLPASDVESCRLVCRAWNTEACTVLRNKRIVVFVDPEAVKVYNNAMRNTVDFPHAQFEFCIQDFTGLVDENLREFWRLFGSHIKSLEFRQTHLFWRDFLDVVEQNVPNLERLSLRHLPRNVLRSRNVVNERRQISSVKELRLASLPAARAGAMERLTDLLRILPNLEVIRFLPINKGPLKSSVSSLLVDILQKPEVLLPNLKRINLNLELSSSGLDGLASKRFPFQKLHLTLCNGVKATSFKELLNSLKPSLSDLSISFPDNFSNSQTFAVKNNSIKPEECVQLLTNLKILRMKNFKGSIDFVQKMPELEKLNLTTSNLAQCMPFGFKQRSRGFGFSRGSDDHPLKRLKILPTSSDTTVIAETLTLESISRCFPYLNSIHLQGVDDDGLGVIYRNLPFLSEVELIKSNCTDQGLTGIPLEICNDMLETSTYIVVQAEKYRRDLFIGSLQFLRRFSIDASKISDASIALGLADCKNLKDLKIGSPLITDTGVIFITDKFWRQLDHLDVSECTEITEQSKFYAGEKLIGKIKVADTTPEDLQAQTKPPRPERARNPNRGIIKLRKTLHFHTLPSLPAPSAGPSNPTAPPPPPAHSKFYVEDTEFFEEHSEEEIRDRGLAFFAGDRNRQRVVRIREALRRNGDFMRNFQRMGIQQFQRLYRRELMEAQRVREMRDPFIPRNLDHLAIDWDNMEVMLVPPEFNQPQPLPRPLPQAEDGLADENPILNVDDGEVEPDGESSDNDDDFDAAPYAVLQPDVDGGPIFRAVAGAAAAAAVVDGGVDGGGDAGARRGGGDANIPNRLPEIHIAELFRLGLRPDDIEFWLRNRPLFERDENAAGANLPAVLHAVRADALRARVNIAAQGQPNAPVMLRDDEDIDLEAIRRVVLNAFGDDLPELPLEG